LKDSWQSPRPPSSQPVPEIARAERRFGLGTMLVATVFFAILFAILRQLRTPWYGVVAVVVFLVGIAAAQMLIEDAKKARVASMIAGTILYILSAVVISLMARRPWFDFHFLDACQWVSLLFSGMIAGYVGGVFVAGVFLVSQIVENAFARPSESDRTGEVILWGHAEIVRTIDHARIAVRDAQSRGKSIGLVPTMGALHDGHLSLIRRARAETGFVVVSIFVNPTQFGPHEDLWRYPRPFERDVELCKREGVDVIFAPEASTIYPPGFATFVDVEGLSQRMEGAFRPSHFRGVATVVLKLFQIVAPDVAYFGQKDAQQARVIQQMVRDLNVPVEIRVCPIVREPDGLALSSRNVYLSADERAQAIALSRSLHAAKELIGAGERDANSVRQKMRSVLESAHDVVTDYAELVDPITFEPVQQVTGPVLAVVAARVGTTRLIDNLPIEIPHASSPV
jgi:pantoate--beta-alanine ligase